MTAVPADDLSIAQRVDACCDQFEEQFTSGQRPRLEDILQNADESLRLQLFRGLLELDLELRRRAGDLPQREEYVRRFPDYAAVIELVFADVAAGVSRRLQAKSEAAASSVKTSAADTSRGPVAGPMESTSDVPTAIGRFQILQLLGEGAFGAVYRARDPQLDRDVAIKVPRSGTLNTQEERDRFLREARAAAGLHQPHICPVHEVGTTTDGRDYIVMAFIDGKPLSKILQSGQKLSQRQVAGAIRKLALALDEAHQKGVIHRDLKPANIMINRKGEPVIMDFGLARRENSADPQLSHSGQIMGTPAYMSPEQARGDSKKLGPATDIYSLGVVMYEMLCGQRPFSGSVTEVLGQILHVDAPPPSKFREGIDPKLQAICLKTLAKNPAERYASMKDLAAALLDYQKTGSTVQPMTSATTAEPLDADEPLHTKQLAKLVAAVSSDVESKINRAADRVVRRVTKKKGNGRQAPPFWAYLAGSGLIGVIVLLGILFFVKAGDTTILIQVPLPPGVDLQDTSLAFFLDAKPVAAELIGKPIELTPGEHELLIKRGDVVIERMRFAVRQDGKEWAIARLEDPPPSGPPPAVAPFTAEQARQHQEAWAKHLGVPVEYTNSIGMKFRLIPPGTYRRGLSPEDVAALAALDPEIKPESLSGEQPQHVVRLTKPYWLGVHEVTVGQFRQFVDAASFVTRAEVMARSDPKQRTWKSVPWEQTDAHPVVNVNWNEAQAFAHWLSQWDAWDYRLPTEAEWEFACRAGTESLWWSGNDLDALARVANIADAAAEPRWKPKSPGSRFMSATDGHVEAAPVGSLAANPFGLHDTIGNVWEWCSDRYDDKHYGQFREIDAVDPTGPTGGDPRVRRGGSWLHGVQYAHAASRQSSFPDAFSPPYGFRLALSFDPKQARYPIEDRIVARMVLQHGGRIRTTDDQEVRGDPSLLRSTPLRIERIVLGSDGPPAGMTDDQLQQLLIHLASVSELQVLQINKLNVTDAGLQYLFGLKKLRTVNLSDTAVTPAGLRALQDALPDCEITPTPASRSGAAPLAEDGFVSLFNGQDLSNWIGVDGQPPRWKVENGYVEVVPQQPPVSIMTRENFPLDFELHVEFWLPDERPKTGQRANSGVFLHGRHEIQICDSFNNDTIANPKAVCASLYDVIAPSANACTPPETWQTYDITYHSPRVDGQKKVTTPGRITLIHNARKVIDDASFTSPGTIGQQNANVGQPGPILLQDHGSKVRFRNIRLRSLQPEFTTDQAGFVPLFDGDSLVGWQGRQELWSLRDGVLTGLPSTGQNNTFLFSPRPYADFELRFQTRIGDEDNSGVQLRSEILDRNGWKARGPQADIGNRLDDYWGGVYGENMPGGWLLERLSPPPIKPGDWNDYAIRCIGRHVTIQVNGVTTVDGDLADMSDSGLLAFQIHRVNKRPVEFRNLRIRDLGNPVASAGRPLTPQQQRLVSRIQEMGAVITRAGNDPNGAVIGINFYPTTNKPDDALLKGLAEFPELQSLNLWGSEQVTLDGWRAVSELRSLRSLDLGVTRIDNEGVAALDGLRDLETLNLSYTRITDAALSHLAEKRKLRSLAFDNTAITDEGLEHLGRLAELRYLNLLSTRVTGPGLEHIAKLPHLEQLWLGGSPVTDAGVKPLRGNTTLRQFYVGETNLTDAAVDDLGTMTGLLELSIKGTQISAGGLSRLKQLLPETRIDETTVAN